MEVRLEEVNSLCGKDNYIPQTVIQLRNGKKASIVKCQNCGLQYISSRPDKEFLNLLYKESYYNPITEDKDLWTDKTLEFEIIREKDHLYRLNPILKMRNLYGYRKLLDIGTGFGYFLKLAKDKGFDAVGIEVSERASEFARENYGVSILNISEVEEAGLEDDSFDVISLCDVIEHLPYQEDTLKEIHRILRDNGVLLIVTPNYRTFATFLSQINRWLGYPVKPLEDEYAIKTWENGCYHLRPKRLDEKGYRMYLLHSLHHLYFFNTVTLKELLSRSDFSVVKYPAGRYDRSAEGIRKIFNNYAVNLLTRIFNLQTGIIFYARKA
jgi:SAM-dependent methyltransferase